MRTAIVIIIAALVILALAGSQGGTPPSDGTSTVTATNAAPVSRGVHTGDTVTVRGSWPCGSSPAALDEMTRWLVRRDSREAARVAIETGSSIVEAGDEVEDLDLGFMRTKLRVLRTDTQCWVVSEAVTR